MNFLVLLVAVFALTACQGAGGGNASQSTDPIYGEWHYISPGSTNVKAKGIIATIDKDKIFFANTYVYTDGTSTVFYYRKSEGTYKRDGKRFYITYTYETCNPVGSETIDLTPNGNSLTVYLPSKGLGLQMLKSTDSASSTSALAVEDKNCNILAKIEKSQKRAVASEKNNSFFERILNN